MGTPEKKNTQDNSYEKSIWLAKVLTDTAESGKEESFSIRIDIKKTNSVYKKGEEEDAKNHEEDQYDITVEKDLTYLPADIDAGILPDFGTITASVNLHYSSKYAQNMATMLEIQASIKQNETSLNLQGKLKTAAPWIFMPFEINDPIQVGTDKDKEFIPYLTDWVSNAESMISHVSPEEAAQEVNEENTAATPESAPNDEEASSSAETAPLDVDGEE